MRSYDSSDWVMTAARSGISKSAAASKQRALAIAAYQNSMRTVIVASATCNLTQKALHGMHMEALSTTMHTYEKWRRLLPACIITLCQKLSAGHKTSV